MKIERLSLPAALVVASSILVFSVTPGVARGLNSGIEKHLIAYFFLSFSLGVHTKFHGYTAPFLVAALISGAYGACIELLQYSIPYREASIADALANFAGAFLAMTMLHFMHYIFWPRPP